MDRIKWEILEDGTISVTTDAVSKQNHHSADELLDQLQDAVGGEATRKSRRAAGKAHLHQHGENGLHSHQ